MTYALVPLHPGEIAVFRHPGTIKTYRRAQMNRFVTILAAVFASIAILTPLAAQELVNIDDQTIQEYNGKIGRWIFIAGKPAYAGWIAQLGSVETDVCDMNPGAPKILNRYIFFPFTPEYIKKLEEKSVTRRTQSSETDQFIWPLGDVAQITSVLGFRGREFHTGIDIPAPKGEPVLSAMEGQVTHDGYSGGYGNLIEIQHRNGFITRYGHNTALLVKKGDFVKKGQVVALAGSTGRSTGNHVHFEILCNTIPLDPLDFLPDSSKVQVVHRLKNWKHK